MSNDPGGNKAPLITIRLDSPPIVVVDNTPEIYRDGSFYRNSEPSGERQLAVALRVDQKTVSRDLELESNDPKT